jgi:alkanesulfonate monooxygenase SsuD/methylene tetrahydromethanopterin reductase-like flavin-dependent oxidoreductase (luciferase family)
MREALPGLREALPDVRLVLAAMGPKMCAFAGAEWDGVFFNWITPEFAAKARGWVEEGAGDEGREPPTVFGYVRTAVGADAEGRLAKDEAFYRDLHPGYRSHFDRQRAPEGTVGVAGENESVVQAGLSRYRALDVIVVRALASATIENMSALAEAAAPGD